MTDEELIARLRACANGMGSFKSNQGDYGICDDAADRIKALEAEMGLMIRESENMLQMYRNVQAAREHEHKRAEQALSASAAAYEAAASDKVIAGIWAQYGSLEQSKDVIRALSTPDQTAALDRVRAEAKAEGMRAAYDSLFKHPGFLHQISGQTFKAVKLEDAAEGILAAIPKQEQNHD